MPKSDISEGVIRQSLEYVKTGFGLSGVVRMTGSDMILSVDQRNGAIAPADNSTPQSQYPQFTVQHLKTSLRLSLFEWSVLGGMQIDKTELRKGLLGKKIIESSDYLVIFVRPRGALDAPPRAVPVPEFGDDDSSHLLLPPRTRAAGVWPDGVPVMQGVLPLPVK